MALAVTPKPKRAGAAPKAKTRLEPVRDAERTQQAILAAAEAEFAAKGLAGARVDVIAEQAGANKRMLYYYFGSKDDLYLAVLERAYGGMREKERTRLCCSILRLRMKGGKHCWRRCGARRGSCLCHSRWGEEFAARRRRSRCSRLVRTRSASTRLPLPIPC